MQLLWLSLTTHQVAFAAYVFAALGSWRGQRLWPAPGTSLSPLPATSAVILFALAVTAITRVVTPSSDLSRLAVGMAPGRQPTP